MADRKDQSDRVSAIIPMYNAAKVIERALGTALAQTLPCHEIIVVDDCSADESVAVVREMQRRHPKIILLQQERNRGPAAARNRAIAHAGGDWLAILDCDDAWKPDRNRALLDVARRNQADLVFDNVSLYDAHAAVEVRPGFAKSFREFVFDEAHFWDNCVFGSFIYPTLKCFVRAGFLKDHGLFYPDMRYGEDLILYAEIMRNGARAALTSEDFYLYTTRQGEVSKKTNVASQSVPAFGAIADAIGDFAHRHRAHISADLARRIERSRRSYRAIEELNNLRLHRRKRQYAEMLRRLLKPSVLSLVARMKYRQRLVRSFTYDPLY